MTSFEPSADRGALAREAREFCEALLQDAHAAARFPGEITRLASLAVLISATQADRFVDDDLVAQMASVFCFNLRAVSTRLAWQVGLGAPSDLDLLRRLTAFLRNPPE